MRYLEMSFKRGKKCKIPYWKGKMLLRSSEAGKFLVCTAAAVKNVKQIHKYGWSCRNLSLGWVQMIPQYKIDLKFLKEIITAWYSSVRFFIINEYLWIPCWSGCFKSIQWKLRRKNKYKRFSILISSWPYKKIIHIIFSLVIITSIRIKKSYYILLNNFP